MAQDFFGARSTLQLAGKTFTAYRLQALEEQGHGAVSRLPYSLRVLLESALRNCDDFIVTQAHVKALAGYDPKHVGEQEIPFNPGRVVLQDFTGVPAVVDLAALRSAMTRLGGDVKKVNPLIRADLVVDHSVDVDAYGSADAMKKNTDLEFQRNGERYRFLKWGQQAFRNFSVVPPATGIVHQVNLEYLAPVVLERDGVLYPDSCVGTDSHTTMINGLGVVGWGVGGIEAEACMLGQPIYLLIPEVVGFELTGRTREGVTATDVVLTVTQMLRKHGVVNKFVEFFGNGLDHLTLADRATIANMAPEYGATIGFFPVDARTVDYLRDSGRPEDLCQQVEAYYKHVGLWRDPAAKIVFSSTLSLDLGKVEPSLAGPKRPQDRVALSAMKASYVKSREEFGHATSKSTPVTYKGQSFDLADGAVCIAAITSCTNTSNPAVMLAAGLVAKKAAARGLTAKPWVKTSLAPGSRVVSDYLDRAGLTKSLEDVGFFTVGYGCTTCIGNSGPLSEPIREAIDKGDLVVGAVLSGNRNFEGRVSPQTKVNYLASPPLVVAYAIAGNVELDLTTEPLGTGSDGQPVYLKDVWPTDAEVEATIQSALSRDQYVARYSDVYRGPDAWQKMAAPTGELYAWEADSTYIQEPPFFVDMSKTVNPIAPITAARCLAKLGLSVTTDHISPAGNIGKGTPAEEFLAANGVDRKDFNSYGSRRGNDQVMTRGTFANIRIKNGLVPGGKEGGWTVYLGPEGKAAGPFPWLRYTSTKDPKPGDVVSIYDASVKYQQHRVPLVVLAGRDYGMGSSRDWAAKGTYLLGVKVVIAESYERIHRSNLVGMGVLPLQFKDGDTADSLGLTGLETFDVAIDDQVRPLQDLRVTAAAPDGSRKIFLATCRIDTPVEVVYYRNGGILHTVLRRLAD
jgi:aconitate hydratase